MTHNHPYHFNLHPTTVTTANMVFWVAVTLLALRTLKGFAKCTDCRAGRIVPLRCQGSDVILVTHMHKVPLRDVCCVKPRG